MNKPFSRRKAKCSKQLSPNQPNNDSLWTVQRFVEEVEQVRQALGLNKDNFFLLGNS